MTSIDILKKEPLYFYTDTKIAPYGQGASIRVYTNLRAYADLGFDIEVIQFVNTNDEAAKISELPSSNIRLIRVEYLPAKVTIQNKAAFYFGSPKNSMLDFLYAIRPVVIKQVSLRTQRQKNAIHHFEYDHIASAATAFHRLNSVWSNHDISSMRVPLIWKMRQEHESSGWNRFYRYMRLQRIRQSEDLLAKSHRLCLNIAAHEHTEFHDRRNYDRAVLLPMSWPDEECVPRQREWMADGILRMVHLGSVDGFVGYDSLRFILEQVFPLIPADQLSHIELIIVGRMHDSKYSRHIRELANRYPQAQFMGYVEDIKRIYCNVDLQVVGGLRASGLRTRIIESMVYGVPVLSTVEMAKGISHLIPNENILLAKDNIEFAKEISELLRNPSQITKIATGASITYQRFFSRKVASDTLAHSIEKYL